MSKRDSNGQRFQRRWDDPVCHQCGKPMNPVEAMLGTVCGTCVRENHQKATRSN